MDIDRANLGDSGKTNSRIVYYSRQRNYCSSGYLL